MAHTKSQYTRYITNRGKYITKLFTYYPYEGDTNEKSNTEKC